MSKRAARKPAVKAKATSNQVAKVRLKPPGRPTSLRKQLLETMGPRERTQYK